MKKIFYLILFAAIIFNFSPALAKKHTVTKPAENSIIKPNFENKKQEIFEALNLTGKQSLKAEKIYTKSKNEISKLNTEINEKINLRKEIKISKQDARGGLEKVSKLSNEIQTLYFKRDKLQNKTMKKFESVLNKEQKQVWASLKLKGARIYPEIEEF